MGHREFLLYNPN